MVTPAKARMRLSEGGLSDITSNEGLRLEAYRDEAGIATIGYGHTAGVQMGQTIDEAQARTLLRQDVAATEKAVNSLVKTPISQAQYDTLVDFAYNVGTGALAKSTLLKKVNDGDMTGAAAEFSRWVKAGGQVSQGLVNRNQRRTATFTGQRQPGEKQGNTGARSIAMTTTEATTPSTPLKIELPTTNDQLLSTNQQIAAELAALVKGMGQDARNDQENEQFLQALRKEGSGQV